MSVPSLTVHGSSASGVMTAMSTTKITSNAILTCPIVKGVRADIQTQKTEKGWRVTGSALAVASRNLG